MNANVFAQIEAQLNAVLSRTFKSDAQSSAARSLVANAIERVRYEMSKSDEKIDLCDQLAKDALKLASSDDMLAVCARYSISFDFMNEQAQKDERFYLKAFSRAVSMLADFARKQAISNKDSFAIVKQAQHIARKHNRALTRSEALATLSQQVECETVAQLNQSLRRAQKASTANAQTRITVEALRVLKLASYDTRTQAITVKLDHSLLQSTLA